MAAPARLHPLEDAATVTTRRRLTRAGPGDACEPRAIPTLDGNLAAFLKFRPRPADTAGCRG